MHKKLFKVAAIVVCLGILSLYVTGIAAAEKKAPKADKKFMIQPVKILVSIFPILRPIIKPDKKAPDSNPGMSVRVTGGLKSGQVSDDD